MAKKPQTILQDDGSIAVAVDDPDVVVVEVPEEDPVEAAEEPVPRPIKSKKPATQVADPQPVVDTRYQEAQARFETAESARKAAEATAAAERQRAEAAERDRQRLLRDQEDLQERANTSELALIDNSIAAATRELEAQQEAYTHAAEAGEFAKMAQIQTKLSRAVAQLDRYEAQKAQIEAQPTRREPTHEGRVVEQQSNPIENALRQYSPAAQNWLRQHMDCMPVEYGGNHQKNSAMMQGHYAALAKGLRPDSPEYFTVIEESLGLMQPAPQAAATSQSVAQSQVTSKAAEVTPAAPRATPNPSAPVSRDAPTASGQTVPRSAREVRLTKDQQEMARVSYPHLPEAQAYGLYARSLIELEAEGKMGRLTH